jgi:hypothetical protein
MQEITVSLPEIPASIIAQLEQQQVTTHESETAALTAIRVKYAPLGRHNGNIKIAYSYVGNSNFRREDERYYEIQREGRTLKLKGLLADNSFTKEYDSQNRGTFGGSRLYLTEGGTWLQITREGYWSDWQGEPIAWGCGVSVYEESDEYAPEIGGDIKTLTDDQVAAQYKFVDLLATLSASLATLAEKLPQRMTTLQQRATLASQFLAAIK